MASVAYAITSTTLVKQLLNLTSTDAARDALIDNLVSEVTDFIEGFCGGRRFKATDYVEVYDTNNSDKIFLNQRPVNSITSVEYRTGLPSSPTWMTWSADSYLKYLGPGYIKFFTRFSPFAQAFRVTYNAGYTINLADFTQGTLPADLIGAATELCAQMFQQRFTGGIKNESTEGQSVTYEKVMSDNIKNVLNKYKTTRIAGQ